MKMLIIGVIVFVETYILYELLGQLVELTSSKLLKRLSKIALYISCLMPLQGGDLENAYFILLIYLGVGVCGSKDTLTRKLGNTFLFYAMTLAIKMISVRGEWLLSLYNYDDYIATIVEVGLSTVLFYIVYKLFKQVMARTKEVISDRIWMMLTMIAVAVVAMVIMSMLVVSHRGDTLMNIMVIGLMLICLMSVIAIFFIIEQMAKGAREETERKKLEWELEYYNDLKESQEQTKKVLHDMKNHIGTVSAMIYTEQIEQATDYLRQLSGELNEQRSKVYCQHHVANALLNNKIKKMQENCITYDIECELPQEMHLSQMEVGSILSNTIDNAIEACSKLEKQEDRIIQMKARFIQGKLIYEIKNTKSHEIIKQHTKFVTTKADKMNHGYGLRQIEDVVNRHNGVMEVEYNQEWFRVTLVI